MAINAGTAMAYLDLDTSGFRRGLSSALKEFQVFNNRANDASKRLTALGQTATITGKTLTTGLTLPLTAIGGAAVNSAIQFESAFAGVRKTVDGTEEDFAKLEQGIQDMAKTMPQSASDIAGVAEAAGQLGIQTDSILDFTKTMIMLGDATNLSSEEAATQLARFANIVQMSQDNFDRLGSSVVALGNNLATTEAEIVAMGMRLAGAGNQIGLTEAQIMSFAGALSSVGIEAEVGGTAFSKVMIELQSAVENGGKTLEDFANVANMTSEQFAKAFKEDAAGAIVAFISGLNDTERLGKSTLGVIESLGMTEIRLRDTLLRAAGAGDLLSQSLEIGTTAWEENNALANEAEQRYATMASRLAMLKNRLNDVAMQVGDILMPYFEDFVGVLENLFSWLDTLDPKTKEFVVKLGLLAASLGPILLIFGKLIQAFLQIKSVLSVLSPVIQFVIGLFTGTSGLGAVISALTGPIGILVAAIAALALAWKNDFAGIREFTSEVIDRLMTIFSIFVEHFQGTFGDRISQIIETVKEVFKALEPVVSTIFDLILDALDIFIALFSGDLGSLKDAIDNWVKDSVKLFENFAETLFNIGKILVQSLWDGMKEDIDKVSDWVREKIGAIKEFFGFENDYVSSSTQDNARNTLSTGLSGAQRAISTSNSNSAQQAATSRAGNTYIFNSPKAQTPAEQKQSYEKVAQRAALGF